MGGEWGGDASRCTIVETGEVRGHLGVSTVAPEHPVLAACRSGCGKQRVPAQEGRTWWKMTLTIFPITHGRRPQPLSKAHPARDGPSGGGGTPQHTARHLGGLVRGATGARHEPQVVGGWVGEEAADPQRWPRPVLPPYSAAPTSAGVSEGGGVPGAGVAGSPLAPSAGSPGQRGAGSCRTPARHPSLPGGRPARQHCAPQAHL